MRRRAFRSLCVAACVVLVSTGVASAGGEVRRGSCSGGEGHWVLRVERVDRNTLAVRFKIVDVDPGESWQLFLSDNGVRVHSATKVADARGEVRIQDRIRDRAGTDRIRASGVNVNDGTTCQGSVSF